MLRQLRVENYAVIDNVSVEFGPGLNLLTGETGAGKSILIDALALLLGDKASSDMVRHGCERAVVSCLFDTDEGKNGRKVAATLEANGIDLDDSGLILRREIATSGKARVFINNQPAAVSVLKQLAPELANIHAQNESILAFDASARLQILDTFASVSTENVAEAYARLSSIRQQMAELERGEQDRLRLVDLWSFQNKEIADARLQPGEDEKLETEKRVLANSEKLYAAAMGAYGSLYDDSNSASTLLRNAEKQLEELARYDPQFQEGLTLLQSARAGVEEVSISVRDYAEGINASPERLATIEDRLALLDRLKRKYGSTLDQVIAYGEEVARKLDEVENRDVILDRLRHELGVAKGDYLSQAKVLSKKRRDAAKKLQSQVESEINDLAMRARFQIEVAGSDQEADWHATGFDSVIYLIATNAGEPLKPVEQIASGGELSRVMLALKSVAMSAVPANGRGPAKRQRTLVFDEIDIGIGGRAAEAVGKKLKSLALANQVLCITHLPQIASFADQHYLIEKKESAGKTKTTIRQLSSAERTEEVARMLSGAKLTDTSLKHAEQMLKASSRA
ncbi:MAG TPA: DNA repair protein RecN [Terriglobales bacterium]|nr:DNA repair protein RecN [Terriglobales bacterium]